MIYLGCDHLGVEAKGHRWFGMARLSMTWGTSAPAVSRRNEGAEQRALRHRDTWVPVPAAGIGCPARGRSSKGVPGAHVCPLREWPVVRWCRAAHSARACCSPPAAYHQGKGRRTGLGSGGFRSEPPSAPIRDLCARLDRRCVRTSSAETIDATPASPCSSASALLICKSATRTS